MNVEDVEIGASEAPAALGHDHWKTPLALYAEKMKIADPREESEAMRLGRYLEPMLASMFEDEFDVKLHKAETEYHPDASWLRSSKDYYFTYDDASSKLRDDLSLEPGEHIVVEMKSSGLCGYTDKELQAERWGANGGDVVPANACTQVQTQILTHDAVLKAMGAGFCTRGMIKSILAGRGVPTFRVIGTPEIHEYIFRGLHTFVFDHLLRGVPPAPQDLEDWGITEELVRQPMRAKEYVQATPADLQLVAAWRMAKAAAEGADIIVAAARTNLIRAIGSAYGLEGPWGHVAYTAGRELPRTAKAGAYDAIMKLIDGRGGSLADSIREIHEQFTKPAFTGRQLRPHWTDEQRKVK